jgi:hypothetical protein
MTGRIYFHQGDDSAFSAVRAEDKRDRSKRRASESRRTPHPRWTPSVAEAALLRLRREFVEGIGAALAVHFPVCEEIGPVHASMIADDAGGELAPP